MEVIRMAEEKQPIPLEAVRQVFRECLREQGVDPDTVDFKVSHAHYIGTFGGETKTIKITVLELPDGSTYQWFPENPDGGPYGAARRGGD
jgi:hypothetical protein